MLQAKLDSLDGLDESLKGLYEESDGVFKLQIEGLEDTSALKNAKDRQQERAKSAEANLRTLNDDFEAFKRNAKDKEDEGHRNSGDVDSLDASWTEKYNAQASKYDGTIDSLNGTVNKLLVDNQATSMAAQLAVEGSAEALLPHIKSRLGVEERNGEFVTVVKGVDGKSSALTLDELKTEISNHPAFAPLIIGSKANGSGATGGDGVKASQTTDYSAMSADEKITYIESKEGN